MKKALAEKIEALRKELLEGVSMRTRLEVQLKSLNEQMLRIEGAKILAEELLRGMPESENKKVEVVK